MDKGIVFAAFVLFLLLPGIVEAACSIGANPLSVNVRATPGQTVVAVWNLYNIHGDRITHVRINTTQSPDGWEIRFEPGLHNTTYNVTGVLQTIEENVGLEPSSVIETLPETVEENMDYVRHPSGDGYIPVKPIKAYVKVPEDAELGENYNFTFEVIGNCFMEPGAVIPAVATELKLSIETVLGGEFYEETVSEICADGLDNDGDGMIDCDDTDCETADVCRVAGGGITGFLIANAPWAAIVIILLVYFGFVRKRSKEKYRGYSYTPE